MPLFKRLSQTLFLYISLFVSLGSFAQESCSFIIHVSPTGSDNPTCGNENSPCSTINYGINIAQIQNLSDVRVAQGTYNEVVTLADGINLWGGFDGLWNQTATSTVIGGFDAGSSEFLTLKGTGIGTTGNTIISDFTIIAPNASSPGKSSYGIHLNNCPNIQIQNCLIIGGSGANGSDGVHGTNASSLNAASGSNGVDGFGSGSTCSLLTAAGGIGGTGTSSQYDGGDGGQSGAEDTECLLGVCSNCAATSGSSGNNASVYITGGYGAGGAGGAPCQNGQPGNDGRTVHGNGGAGGNTSTTLVGVFWVSTAAADGTLGLDGTGGGGGGGGGGCDFGTDTRGGGGGGGGAGGLRAPQFGYGGLSGGNSTGLFAFNSQCTLVNTNFTKGSGGTGGLGGNSGSGQPGGPGGSGGIIPNSSNLGWGGDGGNGGDGGDSGAGGGGAGGSVFGIFGYNSTFVTSQVLYSGGAAGVGGNTGASINAAGTNGADGINNDIELINSSEITQSLSPTSGVCTEILTISTDTILCAGDSIMVDYNAVGDFFPGNSFFAELSDASGSFATPTQIGSVNSINSGSIPCHIPETTPAGSSYLVRVSSTAAASTGDIFNSTIEINSLPNVTYGNLPSEICEGDSAFFLAQSIDADIVSWNNGISDSSFFTFVNSGYFTVSGLISSSGCSISDSLFIQVNPIYSAVFIEYACDSYTSPSGQIYTQSGIYYDTLSTSLGCDSIFQIDITIHPLPDNSVTHTGDILSANQLGAYYQWLNCDDNYSVISGENNQFYTPQLTGNYAVEITTINGCVDTSICYLVDYTGLSNLYKDEISIYPNPTTDIIKINGLHNVQGLTSITINSTAGELVFEMNEMQNSINVSQYPAGVYFLKIHHKAGIETIQFVKSKD